eukprot:134347_1
MAQYFKNITMVLLLNIIAFRLTVCTVLESNKLACPLGTEQLGPFNAFIPGCGLEECDARYSNSYHSIVECKNGCNARADCVTFTWSPSNDTNPDTVCSLFDSDTWFLPWPAPTVISQIMCKAIKI